jgi:hypothetical protein
MTAHFRTSAPTHRAFMTRKSLQTPWQRERKHGRYIEPLHPERICGLQSLSNAVVIGLAIVVAYLCMSRGWAW